MSESGGRVITLSCTRSNMPYDPRRRYECSHRGSSYSDSRYHRPSFPSDSSRDRRRPDVATLLANIDLWATELPLLASECFRLYNNATLARDEGSRREFTRLMDSLKAQLESVDEDLRWDGLGEAPRRNVRR